VVELNPQEAAQHARALDCDVMVWANEASGRHYYARLVHSDLALPRVLHYPAPPVVDVSDLPTDRCRGVVAHDVARLALVSAELVEREPDYELPHQRAGPRALVGSAQPRAGHDLARLREVVRVQILHPDQRPIAPNNQG